MAIPSGPYAVGAPSRKNMSNTAKRGARDLERLAQSRSGSRPLARSAARPARFEYDDEDDPPWSGRASTLFTDEEVDQVARHVPCGTIDFEPPYDDPSWERIEPYSVTALHSRKLPHHVLDEVYANRRHVSLLGLYSLARLDRQRVASFSAPIPYSLPFNDQWVLTAVVVAKSAPRWTQASAGPGSVPELGQELIHESNPLIDSDDEALDRALKKAHEKAMRKPGVNKEKHAKQRRFITVTLRDLRRGPQPLVPLEPQGGRQPNEEIHLMIFEADRKGKKEALEESVQPSEFDALFGGSNGAFEKMQMLPLGSVVALISPKIMPFRVGDQSTALTVTPPNARSLLHLGQAADYGQCEARKSDQRKCHAFVDKRRLASSTSAVVCALHQGLAMDRLRVERPELAPAGRFAPGQTKNSYHRAKEQDPWEGLDVKPNIASEPEIVSKPKVAPKPTVGPNPDRDVGPKLASKSDAPIEGLVESKGRRLLTELEFDEFDRSRRRPDNDLWPETRKYPHDATVAKQSGSDQVSSQEDWETIFRASLQRKGKGRSLKQPSERNAGDMILNPLEDAELQNSHQKHTLEHANFRADPADEASRLYDVQAQLGRGKSGLKAMHAKRKAQEVVAECLERPRTTLRRFDDPEDEEEQVQLAASAYEAERAKGDELTLYRSLGPSSSAATKIMERAHSLIDARREQETMERKRKQARLESARRKAKKPARGALSMSSSEPEEDETLSQPVSKTTPQPSASYRLQTSMMRQIGFDPFAGKPVRSGAGAQSSEIGQGGDDTASRLLSRTISSRTTHTAAPSLKRPSRPHWRNVRPPPGTERTAKQQAYDGLYGLKPDDLSDLDMSDGLEL